MLVNNKDFFNCPTCGGAQEENAVDHTISKYLGRDSMTTNECVHCYQEFTTRRCSETQVEVMKL